MKIRFLGTGTSSGVPQLNCRCEVCASTDKRDSRLRTSAIVSVNGRNILIDCGPDFRSQIIAAGQPDLDALLVTHSHYDHVGGIDDLRPYCYRCTDGFPVFCRPDVAADLRSRVPYCFREHPYPGVPRLNLIEIDESCDFVCAGITVTPLPVMHMNLPIIGFRIGSLAYITDCKTMPDSTIEKMKGIRILVINALQHKEHLSHMNLHQALDVINKTSPERAYLTHLSHRMGLHDRIEPLLPPGVKIAYDGLVIDTDIL